MKRFLRRLTAVLSVIFFLPALLSLVVWSIADRPGSWREADWSSAAVLPVAAASEPAALYVMKARTGGLKGALSVHCWIVIKKPGAVGYERYDKVGWGLPVRRNNWAADARWYSNEPEIVKAIHGPEAERLIPLVEEAIAGYPENRRGDYQIWPGPNSNSFVAHVLRSVPEIGIAPPALAVGRDFLPDGGMFRIDPDGRDMHLSLFGLAGVSLGYRSGFEMHLLGLVAGFDLARPGVKLPGIGRIGI